MKLNQEIETEEQILMVLKYAIVKLCFNFKWIPVEWMIINSMLIDEFARNFNEKI